MLTFNLPPQKRFMIFLCITVLCLIAGSILIGFITLHGITVAKMRIATILQDIVMFVLPSIATAMVITRRPAEFLMLGRAPRLLPILLTVAVVVSSIPLMNVIVEWNAHLKLPEALRSVEEWMHSSEDQASKLTETMLGGNTVGSLVMSILIVGVLAGFSEEIFFRGTLQRLMSTTPMNPHVAVWTTAIVFSAIHMQFFGFIPRMLLGALFGYAALWSGNLWLAVAAHITNNTLAATAAWLEAKGIIGDIKTFGANSTPSEYAAVAVSAVLTALLLFALWHTCRSINRTSCD